MERKKKIEVPGRGQVDATEVGFRSSGEHWNEYLADDGSVIRVKLVVTEVLRIEGEHDPAGNPVYAIQSQNVMAVLGSRRLAQGRLNTMTVALPQYRLDAPPLDGDIGASATVEVKIDIPDLVDVENFDAHCTSTGRPIPLSLIETYAAIAARHYRLERTEIGRWFAVVPGLQGVWGEGATEQEAIEQLPGVIYEWALLKVEDGDGDIPPMEGIDLNPPQ